MKIEVASPFPFHALPRIWGWIAPFREAVADDFAPQTLQDFMGSMADRWKMEKTWAIYAGEELGGLIMYQRLNPWLGTAHVLLKPDFQGRGFAVRACRQAVGEMFREGIGKLVFEVLGGNLAVGSLLTNVGAKREGTLEGHTLSGGKPRDVWVYGLSKEAFEEKQHGVSVQAKHADNNAEPAATADQ